MMSDKGVSGAEISHQQISHLNNILNSAIIGEGIFISIKLYILV